MKRFFVGSGLLVFGTVVTVAVITTTGVASPSTAAPQQSNAKAQELVDTWIEALGGLETYGKLESARYTLTTEIYDTESGRLRRTRPRYVSSQRTDLGELTRIERWEGDDFIQQAWTGITEWAALNGETLSAGHRDFDEVQYVSGDVNYWISLPFKLKDPGVNLHDRGLDEGRHVVGVTFGEGVGLHDGDSWQYWFVDGQTWPVQVAYKEEGRTNWSLLRFEDIRTVDGYTFVGRRVHYNQRGELTKVLFTHDFELNPQLEPSLFAAPQ